MAKGADVNAVGKTAGITPLHDAAHGGHTAIIKALLAKGAEVDRPLSPEATVSGTALHSAAGGGHVQVVRRLLDGGARVSAPTSGVGFTPLHYAAMRGKLPVVRLLVERGARKSELILGGAYAARSPEVGAWIERYSDGWSKMHFACDGRAG